MTKALLCLAVLSSSAALAQTPLNRYLPAGALGVLEARELGPGYNTLQPLLRQIVRSVDPTLDFSSVNTGAAFLWGSLGRESTLGVYTVGKAGSPLEPHFLAVTRTNAATSTLLRSQIDSGYRRVRVGAYSFVNNSGTYVGQGYGVGYASSSPILLRAFLERLQGSSSPSLAQNPKYQEAMKGLEGSQLSVYLNLEAGARYARSLLAEVFVPRILDPLLEALNTAGQTGLGLKVVPDGIEARSVQVLNPAGKDRDLRALLSAQKTRFDSLELVPSTAYTVQTCALDPVSTPRFWAKWLTRLDLFDPSGLLMDSDLANTLLDSSAWLGDEESTVTLRALPENPQSVFSNYQNTVYLVKVRDEAAAEQAMRRFIPAFNTSVRGAVQFYRRSLDSFTSSLGSVAGMGSTGLEGLLEGDLELEYRVQNGYLFLASQAGVLEDFLSAPQKLSSLSAVRALPQGGRCLSYAGSTKLTRAQYRTLLEQNAGTSAAFLPPQTLDQIAGSLEQLQNRLGGLSSSVTVQGNRIVGVGKLKVKWN